MKKLTLKLDGVKEMLTREQMKKISGGYDNATVTCAVTYSGPNPDNANYGSGTYNVDCSFSNDLDECQRGLDHDCENNNCCSDADCEYK